MAKLTIVRGLPGSGKTTYAEKMTTELVEERGLRVCHYEADQFFTDPVTGQYRFNPKLISQAHTWCFVNAIKSLCDECDVVVSNTFTQLWEMERYLKIAEFVPGTEVEVVEIWTQYESIHDVPAEKQAQMRRRWEQIPAELGVTVLVIGADPLDAYNEERLVTRFDKV